VMQCVAVCCSVLQCVAVKINTSYRKFFVTVRYRVVQCAARTHSLPCSWGVYIFLHCV